MMKEDFLHFIWKYSLFNKHYLFFGEQKVEVMDTGVYNTSSGPDFFNARIKIADTTWAGNVEIHVKASDWFRHGHQNDPAYDSVILHVVYVADRKVYRENNEEIPVVRLVFNPSCLSTYEMLLRKEEDKDCYHYFSSMENVIKRDWLGKLELIRLERKWETIVDILKRNKYDWEATLYELLALAFGMKLNADPFRMLSQSIPLSFLIRNRFKPELLIAAFYGQAGFLEEKNVNEDILSLKKEFQALRTRLPKQRILISNWKYLGLRPAGFPEMRIFQFMLFCSSRFPLFEKIKQCEDLKEIEALFTDAFDNICKVENPFLKNRKVKLASPGLSTIHNWIINAIIPLLFAYGKYIQNQTYTQRCITFLEQLPAENNEILKKWNKFGIIPENAFDSQALIELKTEFCRKRNCINCLIGHRMISDAGNK